MSFKEQCAHGGAVGCEHCDADGVVVWPLDGAHGVEAVEVQRRTDVVLCGLFDQLRRGTPAEAE